MKLEENVEKILDAHPLAEVLTAMPGRESGPGPASCSGSVTVTFPSTADAAAYVGLAAVTHRAGPSIRGETAEAQVGEYVTSMPDDLIVPPAPPGRSGAAVGATSTRSRVDSPRPARVSAAAGTPALTPPRFRPPWGASGVVIAPRCCGRSCQAASGAWVRTGV